MGIVVALILKACIQAKILELKHTHRHLGRATRLQTTLNMKRRIPLQKHNLMGHNFYSYVHLAMYDSVYNTD